MNSIAAVFPVSFDVEVDKFLSVRRYASVGLSASNVSVCPSVKRRYCVKTKKASVMISSPSGRAVVLVFWCQISSPHFKGFPELGSQKKGGVGKFGHFLDLIINISKTVAYRAKVTIND